MTDTVTALPVAPPLRWRPTRAGLISLWRYWDEVFTFHHGRLLLRGPNGAGKSMALELLLPFLLDADASAARLTAGARPRGGLYERVMTGTSDSSRAGFAWVELARGDEVFTIGARIRASASTRSVDLHWFTTSQRIGTELHLLDPQRVPLSRKELAAAIGDHGRVHGSGAEHRAAVRERLFPGFGEDRYASVVTALLALRKEKLSQNLDLDKLSAVLSEALPPIDEQDLTAVAEGFAKLDRRRAALATLEGELAAAKALAARQRSYARALLAGLTDRVVKAETDRDNVTRSEREARTALADAQQQLEALAAERAGHELRLDAIREQAAALRDRDAYREGAALEDLRTQARRLEEVVARDERRVEEARERAAAAAADAQEEGRRAQAAGANLTHAAADLQAAAAQVGAGAPAAEATTMPDPDAAERLLRAWTRTRRERVGEVRAAVQSHLVAVAQRTFAEGRVTDDDDAVEARVAARNAAVDAFDAGRAAWLDALGDWVPACAVIGPDRVRAALPSPLPEPAGVRAAVGDLAADLQTEAALAGAEVEQRRAAVAGHRAELAEERAAVTSGRVEEPPAPSWRDDRDGRPGAPLWQLVDPLLDGAELDGLEAALAASGLLDAWVAPDGGVALPAAADLALTPAATANGHLGGALQPLQGAAVAADVVAGVLAAVRVVATVDPAEHEPGVVIGRDGTFRLGSAFGRAPRSPASLLGAAARERRRLARLAELDGLLAAADADLAALEREAQALAVRAAAYRAEVDALPRGEEVEAAAAAVGLASARLAEAEARLADSREALRAAEGIVRTALRALTTVAARHGLPTDGQALDGVAAALDAFEHGVTAWARRARDLRAAERARERADAATVQAAALAGTAAEELDLSRRDALGARARLEALESSVGAEYAQIVTALSGLDTEARARRSRRDALDRERPALDQRTGELRGEVASAAQRRQDAEDQRATAHRRLAAAVRDGLAADAGAGAPGPLENATAVLDAARTLGAELQGVAGDHQATQREHGRVAEAVHQAQGTLGGRVDLAHELSDDGWWLLRALVSGLRRRVGELRDTLAHELAAGQEELAAEEERLFEQTLAGSVRRALAARIRLGNELVDGINAQLDAVRSQAGGVAVRLRWDVDADQPDAVRSARALLLRDPADLDEGQRAALQEFVRARVDQARAELAEHAPWEARLRETLDYRAWHRFTLQIAHRDWDGYQPATARRLARLSTGERSIALHLPMLASIAAHYADDRGQPSGCPRLILLDELFAGVDTANRAQLFGTFTAWDLDAVFTSDHEWCQYATLDGIAIHHLHPPTGDQPVTSTRFTWDGRQRVIDPAAA